MFDPVNRSSSILSWLVLGVAAVITPNLFGRHGDEEISLVRTAMQPATVPEPDGLNEPDGESPEASPPTITSPFLSSPRPVRIARAPEMFGDFFATPAQLAINRAPSTQNFGGIQINLPPGNLLTEVPLAAGTGYSKAAENNKAMPDDRAYLLYNHFDNALAVQRGAGPATLSDLDRYTLGYEKTFFCSLMSVEIRLPVSGTFHHQSTNMASAFNVQAGKAGNLGLFFKGLLHRSECSVISAGLGIGLPTGSDLHVRSQVFGLAFDPAMVPLGPVTENLDLVIQNEALHLQPFLALSHLARDRLFLHAFLQADLIAGGNPVTASFNSPFLPPVVNQQIGQFGEQNLLFIDAAAGYWLRQDPEAGVLQGLAGLLELHYTTTLQNTDAVQAGFPPATNVLLTNTRNRMDIVNLTAGLHLALSGNCDLRVAAVWPLKDFDDRFFDSEISVSFIKRL